MVSRLLFVGDLQIGAGERYGTPECPRLTDQEGAWRWIIEQATVDWAVDAIVLLGDVFDKRYPTPAELLAFKRPLALAKQMGLDVLAIAGNHDVSAETAHTALEVFGELMDVHRTPAVWGGRVATLPWTPPHRLAAAHGREQINERVAHHLVECARELRLPVHANIGIPSILALHWSISGFVTASGVETISLAEPVLPLEALLELGYRWIVAGHIHKPQEAGNMAGTNVIIAGSPMVSDFGEAEGEHGVWVVDTEAGDSEFKEVPDRPFVTLDYRPEDHGFGIFPGHNVEGAVVRIRYTASPEDAAKVDHSALERALYEAGAHKVYAIEPTILREKRARVETMDETQDPIEALGAWAEAQGLDRSARRVAALREYTAESLERT